MEFETSEERQAQIGKALDVLREHSRGELVPHGDIETAIGIRRKDRRSLYDYIVSRARARLQKEDGIATWHCPNTGYRLETKSGQLVDVQCRRFRKADSQYRRARRTLAELPEDGLTRHERGLRVSQIETVRSTRKYARSQAKALASVYSQKVSVPQIKVGNKT